MECLVDTNVLLILAQSGDPAMATQVATANAALTKLRAAGYDFWIAPQNLTEFYSVATRPVRIDPSTGRPRRNSGLGWTSEKAMQEIRHLKLLFNLLEEDAAIYPEWERLIDLTKIRDTQSYDARLAAIMSIYLMATVLTFNPSDFLGIPGLTVLDPQTV